MIDLLDVHYNRLDTCLFNPNQHGGGALCAPSMLKPLITTKKLPQTNPEIPMYIHDFSHIFIIYFQNFCNLSSF